MKKFPLALAIWVILFIATGGIAFWLKADPVAFWFLGVGTGACIGFLETMEWIRTKEQD